MSVVYKNTLIKIDELPKINGECIDAIYPMKYYEEYNEVKSCYKGDTPDYYYCTSYFRLFSGRNLRIKELPKEFKNLIGNDRYISYRVKGSGNGSFVDDSIRIHVIDSPSIFVTRGDNKTEFSDIGIEMLNTLNKEYTCEEVGEYEFIKTDSIPFRIEGGLSYPDKSCIGWRGITSPYVSNEIDSKDNIRVYDVKLNAHIYLQRVQPKKGDTDLVRVQFPRDEGGLFCLINKWSFGENEFIRYTIDVMHKDGMVSVIGMFNEEKRHKCRCYSNDFYKIINIIKISE